MGGNAGGREGEAAGLGESRRNRGDSAEFSGMREITCGDYLWRNGVFIGRLSRFARLGHNASNASIETCLRGSSRRLSAAGMLRCYDEVEVRPTLVSLSTHTLSL